MKLATVEHDGSTAVVVTTGPGEVAVLPDTFADLGGFAQAPDEVREAAVRDAVRSGARLPAGELRWLPPVSRPGKILCVALNNSANPARIVSGPGTPALFTKPSSALVGHDRAIRLRAEYGRVHPEPELAVVIGRTGTDVDEAAAISYVLGYSILNDLTAPALRAEDTFHYRAVHPDPDAPDGTRYVESWVSYPARYKGADTFAPLGPWLTTADEIDDPHRLRITCRHNGNLVTDDNTANLRFSVAEVIAFASRYLTLEPGDVIGMGTALQRSATGGAVQNLDLNTLGGRVEVGVDGLGTLSNPVERR